MSLSEGIAELGQHPGSASFDIFRQHLDPAWVEQALLETGTTSVRNRKIPAALVVWLLLGMALLRDRSIPAVLAHLHLHRVGPPLDDAPPTSGAIVQARDRLGQEPMQVLFELTAGHWFSQGPVGPWFHGLRMLAVDGSVLRVPDSEQNAEVFGVPKSGRSRGAYPQLRLLTVLDCVNHGVLMGQMGTWDTGELSVARPFWEQLPDHSVINLDRGFLSYAVFHYIRSPGIQRHWVTRAKARLRWKVIRALDKDSDLIELELSAKSRRKDPSLPKTLRVRAIRYQFKGYRPQILLTSLLDPVQYPAADVVALYHERWEVELAYDEIKTHTLEKREAHLRSQTPERVYQEAWGLLTAYNLVRVEMAAIAQEAGVPPRRISFRAALLIIRNVWLCAWMTTPGAIPSLLQAMRRELKLLILPERRTRVAPREVKIKMSPYLKKQRTHHA
jgi:hypothetical protein